MKKRLLMVALLMVVNGAVFAQSYSTKEEAVEAVKAEVSKNVTENLLNDMQIKLQDYEGKKKLKLKNEAEIILQFLYEQNKVITLFDGKKIKNDTTSLNTIYTALRTNKYQTDFRYDPIVAKSKNDSLIVVSISFQTHTAVMDNMSNAKYNVILDYTVPLSISEETVKDEKNKKVKDENGNPVKKTIYSFKKNKIVIAGSKVDGLKYLDSERKLMKTAAQNAIIEWYANLPQTLDKQYAEQSVTTIKAINVLANEIAMNLPNSQNFTVTDVPEIAIDIDPYQFIRDNDKPLYTDPKALMVIAPIFNISVDDTFAKAKIVAVSYEVKEMKEPITDSIKMERSKTANAVIKEFAKQLSTYVSSRDAAQKAYIENMFDTVEREVEVSYLSKYGSEKIKKESVQKYLSLLKGSSLNWVVDNPDVVNPNWDSLIYTVNQEYQSKTYSDYTQKRIYLTYDSEKGTYLINKITVIPNSTKIK